MPFGRLVFRIHALQRMFERKIKIDDVSDVIHCGEVIEDYPDDFPYPSYLMLGWEEKRPLHVVAADNQAGKETVVITAYEPDLKSWEKEFKRRIP